MCNCDSGKEGVDEGWNTYLQLLPVLELFIGGISNSPQSSVNITIGPLKCTRRRNKDYYLIIFYIFNL